MIAAKEALPSFERPPVTEVAISTSFRALPPEALLRMGHYWDAVREHFPGYEEHPPYESPVERFDSAPRVPRLPFQLSEGAPPPPRLWLLNADGDELLQVQRDWFACNWRKVSPAGEYGRWDSRWDAFKRWFGLFEEHVAKQFGAPVDYVQCEVTYVNHIEPEGVWKHHGEIDQVITLVGSPGDTQLPVKEQAFSEAEAVNVTARYLIQNDEGSPIGRLHVTTAEAFKKADNTPIIQLTLTARGRPEGPGFEGVQRFAERAHIYIVRAFCALTTRQMHEVWGRQPKLAAGE